MRLVKRSLLTRLGLLTLDRLHVRRRLLVHLLLLVARRWWWVLPRLLLLLLLLALLVLLALLLTLLRCVRISSAVLRLQWLTVRAVKLGVRRRILAPPYGMRRDERLGLSTHGREDAFLRKALAVGAAAIFGLIEPRAANLRAC